MGGASQEKVLHFMRHGTALYYTFHTLQLTQVSVRSEAGRVTSAHAPMHQDEHSKTGFRDLVCMQVKLR